MVKWSLSGKVQPESLLWGRLIIRGKALTPQLSYRAAHAIPFFVSICSGKSGTAPVTKPTVSLPFWNTGAGSVTVTNATIASLTGTHSSMAIALRDHPEGKVDAPPPICMK